MTRVRNRLAVGVLVAVAGSGIALTTSAAAQATGTVRPALSATRQDTVNRAYDALTQIRGWRYTQNGANQNSSLHLSHNPAYNYLGANGSNTDRNVYNNFDGEDWCGYFAASIWTGMNLPDPAQYPAIPSGYAGSQNWATGSRFHPYSAGDLPKPADALVWRDTSDPVHGHVGVVVAVSGTTVTTVEGNQAVDGNKDSIVKETYSWTGAGPSLSGKTFLGYRSRSD